MSTFEVGVRRLRDEAGQASVPSDWSASERCTILALRGQWQAAADAARERPGQRDEPEHLTFGLTAWDAIEALLRVDDEALARTELERLAAAADSPRSQLVLHRSRAVLARWESGDVDAHLRRALEIAVELDLPGERWPLLVALADRALDRGDRSTSDELRAAAAVIVRRLADTVTDERLRAAFDQSPPVRALMTADPPAGA